MVWHIKGVRCNSFRHYFLQCYAICLMCFWLIYWVHDSWFKVSNIFSFVKCEVFIGIIRDKYVDRCLALDFMNAPIMLMFGSLPLGVLSPVRKYAIWVLIMGPLIFMGTTPLCLGSILSVDLTVPIVAVQSWVCMKTRNWPFLCI